MKVIEIDLTPFERVRLAEEDRDQWKPSVRTIDGELTLTVYQGKTKRGAWSIESQIVVNEGDLVRVNVTMTTIMGSWSTFYFVGEKRKRWNQLTDQQKQLFDQFRYESDLKSKEEGRTRESEAERRRRLDQEILEQNRATFIPHFRSLINKARWARAALESGITYDDTRVAQRTPEGTFIGFKVLKRQGDKITSPYQESTVWENGEATSDQIPAKANTNGIYAMKSPFATELEAYIRPGTILVMLGLSGTVIEGEEGFRAEHATILQILDEF